MVKIFLFIILTFFISGSVLASPTTSGSRISVTTTTYAPSTSTLVRRNGTQIFTVNFTATATNGSFYILDALTDTTGSTAKGVNVVSEGSQSTSGNSYALSYNPPLQTQTGMYVVTTNGYLTVSYS